MAALQRDLDPAPFAPTNSSDGVMSKMVSPQNIATGVAVTNLRGREGTCLVRTFLHSLILALMLSAVVAAQRELFHWMAPIVGSAK